MRRFLTRFLKDERGLEFVDYAIISTVIVVGAVLAMSGKREWLAHHVANLLSSLQAWASHLFH